MQITTKFDIGQRFYIIDLKKDGPAVNFEPCVKCQGNGCFKGTSGQTHNCRVCSDKRLYPFLPQGFVPSINYVIPQQIKYVVARIWEVEVQWINIHSDSGSGYGISYVYDTDYDGDLCVAEDQINLTIDQAIQSLKASIQPGGYYDSLGPWSGISFENVITNNGDQSV
jgi:hypothetical protein